MMRDVRVPQVHVVEAPDELSALAHPLRLRILEALRTAASAATVARAVGQSRQNVNYHLKELERAGLVRRAGERRKGNFIEALFEAVAPTIVISPRALWGDEQRADVLKAQLSLENLVLIGERLSRDATVLLDQAAFDGAEIPSAAVEAEVHFATEEARAEFVREYLAAVGPLLKKFGRRRGQPYRVAVAVYPDPEGEVDR
jgi:DNA-binding transcriptional ArsR family regulator